MTWLWRRHFLALEGAAVTLTAAIIAWLASRNAPPRIVFSESQSDIIAIMSALASTFGTLLGFVIAVVVFLFTVSGNPAFAVFRASKSYGAHWAIFKGALHACFAATALSVTGLCAAWCSTLAKWQMVLIIVGCIWALLRLARVVWVMKHMIDAEIRLGRLSRDATPEG